MEQTSETIQKRLQFFCDKLREMRNKKGVSAREMSISLGQNVNYINLIENGKRKPSLDMIFYICDYLEVSPDYFFRDSESESEYQMFPHSQVISSLSEKQRQKLSEFILSLKE